MVIGFIQDLIDYGKKLESNRPYVYDYKNWENELYSNITPLVNLVPTNISDESRKVIIDAIIISEAQKLQAKYKVIYIDSGFLISKYVTQRGVHDTLAPLYEQYPTKDQDVNPLIKAFVRGFVEGLHVGTWYAALNSPKSSKNVFKVNSKAEAIDSLKNLPDNVAENIKRFIKKSGSGYTEYAVDILENGNYQVKMIKPGNVSGYAEYYKIIDSSGQTIQTYKDTFDNLGKFIHRKYK